MNLIHIGLVSSSEERADRFFGDLLGLEKTRRSALSDDLAAQLFGIDKGCEIAYYAGGNVVFEVFFSENPEPTGRKISHTCIEVPKRAQFLERCRALGLGIREAPKGEVVVVFVEDHDGNLFEVKEVK